MMVSETHRTSERVRQAQKDAEAEFIAKTKQRRADFLEKQQAHAETQLELEARNLKAQEDLIQWQEAEARRLKAEEERRQMLSQHARQEADAAFMEQTREKRLKQLEEEDALREQRLKLEHRANLVHAEILANAEEDLEKCSICYDRPSKGGVVVGCGHSQFCYECILHWSENFSHRGCPLCRQPMEKIIQLR